jgi:pimeloyl-ACP methyl ester carboxylesterase
MATRFHQINNRDGWRLDVKQVHVPKALDVSRRPLVFVPGYGMNSFILGFHPNGLSMEEYFADAGYEVWSANLRGQGASRRTSGNRRFGFRELALTDLPAVIDAVLEKTHTEAASVDLVGCSLGGTLMYAYVAHNPTDARIGSMVSIGGPLRMEGIHPLIAAAFSSPTVAGLVPFRGTRELARKVLPIARRVPAVLSFYMNASIVDLSHGDRLVQTVENPTRYLNRQISHWIRNKDLVVAGLNISENLGAVTTPLLCVLANRDGVVTPESALSVIDRIGTADVEVLEVGDDIRWFAHADLFVSRNAQRDVFEPMEHWLRKQQ